MRTPHYLLPCNTVIAPTDRGGGLSRHVSVCPQLNVAHLLCDSLALLAMMGGFFPCSLCLPQSCFPLIIKIYVLFGQGRDHLR